MADVGTTTKFNTKNKMSRMIGSKQLRRRGRGVRIEGKGSGGERK